MRRPAAFWALVAGASVSAAEEEVPQGHLEPFGGWRPGVPIEERSDIPEPEEFYNTYCDSDKGVGKPVVFRGAAKDMAAVKNWDTDDYLLKVYPKEKITGVEYNLKETRAGGSPKGMSRMKDFIDAYNTSDIYMVSGVPRGMQKDVGFLPCLRCGGFLQFLDTNNMWMGRGGSKSVIHYDDQDNINCMVAGRKRFVFMHPSYKEQFERHPNSNKNKFGWVDTDLDRKIKGYGAFMGRIDVDKMDLIKYPGWRDVHWSYVDLNPGDCVYIPFQWYHQVTAYPERTINIHVWYWRPKVFDKMSCGGEDVGTPSFSDCTFGYEPPKGHLGYKSKKGKKLTTCKIKGSSAQNMKAAARDEM